MRRRVPRIAMGSRLQLLIEYAWLVVGAFVIALSFHAFLFPNQLASGGVIGLSTVFASVLNGDPAFWQWGMNLPLLIIGLWMLGRRFGAKTVLGSALLPLFVWMVGGIQPVTVEPLLAAVFGGIGVGLGLGMVFRGNASTGGLDVLAQVLHRWTGMRLGWCIWLLDGVVIVVAGLVFSVELALYALIALYLTGKTIDMVQLGFRFSKQAYIISEEYEAIAEDVLQVLDRGLTQMPAVGGYTGQPRTMLMVTLSQNEVMRLKRIVEFHDPTAFLIINDTAEVLGEGFHFWK